jgi:hypothetical protein
MKRSAPALTLAILCLLAVSTASAAQDATSLTVNAVPEPQLVVSYAVAGQPPQPVTSSSARYSVTVAGNPARVTARLASPLPTGVTLQVQLTPPPGAVGMGMVTLSTSATDVVQEIPAGSFSALQIVYRLVVSTSAGVISYSTVDVVFEIVQENA